MGGRLLAVRRRRIATTIGVTALFVVATLIGSTVPAVADTTPAPAGNAPDFGSSQVVPTGVTLSGTPARGYPGTQTQVVGTGWPANAPIQVTTCGNNALNGSPDCTTFTGNSEVTDSKGNFQFRTIFGKPPRPCPCVLHAFSPNLSQPNNFPIELLGHPIATPTKDGFSRSARLDVAVSGSGPFLSWFGFPAERTLDATITNTGTSPMLNPPAYLYLGKGQDPTTLLNSPSVGSINPGQTVKVSLPFELPAMSFGSYTVKFDIPGMDLPVATSTTTSTYPWLLFIVVWLVIQIPLLGLHRKKDDEDDRDSHLIELNDPFGGLAVAGAGTGAAVAALSKSGTNGAIAPVGAASLSSIPTWALGKLTGLNPANPTPSLTPTTNGLANGAAGVAAGAFGVSRIRQFVEAPPTNGHPVSSRVVIGGVSPSATTAVATAAPARSSNGSNPYARPVPQTPPPPPAPPSVPASPAASSVVSQPAVDPLDPSVPWS